MKRIEVVAAVIQYQNKILAVQRGPAKYAYLANKWEFPGGKMEAGEKEEQTIIREIREELHMDIHPKEKLLTVEHTYPDFSIELHTWLCEPLSDRLELNEHKGFVWLDAKDLKELDWAEADVPVVRVLNNSYV